MYEKFSDHARKTMQLANQEAQRFNHEYIGTEHILLGLVKLGEGTAITVLLKLGVEPRKCRLEVEKLVQSGKNMAKLGGLPQTPRAKSVIAFAIEEARNLGHNCIGTEHILLGLLREEEGVAAQILMNFGLKLQKVRDEVVAELGQGNPSSAGGSSQTTDSPSWRSKNMKTPALDSFCTDLVELARNGKLTPLIGREKELSRLMRILCRRTEGNPLLLGLSGVGKTAIVEGLAQKIAIGDVPEPLAGRRIMRLNFTRFMAGTKYRGQSEERLAALFLEIQRQRCVFLFIDTPLFHGNSEATDALKAALHRNEIQCIVAATPDEYNDFMQQDPVLDRQFQPIHIAPTTPAETIEILRGLRTSYERHHNVQITDEAIAAAVAMSDRCHDQRMLPDRAINLLDEAAALTYLRSPRMPDTTAMDEEVDRLNRLKEEAIANRTFDIAADLRDQTDAVKKKKQATIQQWKAANQPVVTEQAVADVIDEITQNEP